MIEIRHEILNTLFFVHAITINASSKHTTLFPIDFYKPILTTVVNKITTNDILLQLSNRHFVK